MKFLFSLHYPKSFIYLIYYSFSGLIIKIISIIYEEIGNNQFLSLFLMNFGDALVVFFYLYEKNKTFKKNDKYLNEYLLNVQSNYKIKIIFILFWCTILDLIDSFDYSYNYDIKKIDSDLIKYLKDTFKFFFIFLIEYYFLNIKHMFIKD